MTTSTTTLTPSTVLVANDEPDVLNILKRLLEHDGYRVVTAADGQRALELAFTSNPDVIISDVVMPYIDGVELCRRLKADSRTEDVPLLLLSARRKDDGDSLEGLIAGADDYLGMPFRSQELMVKVARLAERHRVESYYRSIFEQAADIVYTCDVEGRITGINKAGERFFGRPASSLAGVGCAELFDADRPGSRAGDGTRAVSSDAFSVDALPSRTVHHVRDAEGNWRYLEAVTTVVRDAEGGALSVRGTARDVTERVEAEQRLHASVEQLEALTALATAVKNPSEVDQLFEGLADSITRFTDYRTSLVALFTDDAPYHPRLLSCSSAIPPDYAAHITAGSYPRDAMSQLIKEGVVIEVGELGFAAYYPPTHYHLLDRVFPERFKAEVERRVPREGARWNEGDELFVPLITREGDYVGFISLDDPRSGRAPDRESVLPVVAFARQIAQLLAQQQAAETLAAQAEREALINRITRAVRRSLDPAEVFRTAVEELGSHLEVDACALFILDRERGVVRSVAEHTARGIAADGREYSIPLIDELIEQIQRQGVLAFDDVSTDESIRGVYENVLRDLGTRSLMYAAIRVGEQTPAAFALSTRREARHWRATDIALARAVADQTGIAIRQAELFDMVARAKSTWEATFDAMSDGIFIFDAARGLARVNRAGAGLEDAAPHELLGRRCCDVLRSVAGAEGCIVEKAFAEGRPVTIELTPERLKRPLLVTAEPLHEGAQITGTVCTVRDLSELRKAEREARERQSLLENILESARETIYALDTEGRVQWFNRAALTTGGYRREDLIGVHYLEKTHEADRASVKEHFERALAGEPQAYETRYVASGGQIRHGFVDNAPLVIDGRITGVLGILRDITEQKQERERVAQADKLRALGQLASGVAHDFNNALAAILGRAQLLRRTTSDPEVARSLDIIQTAAEDAAATVRRISTFARQSHGEEFERLDVSELLRDAVEITRTRWENEALARGLRYNVALEADGGLYVEGSASELREVFVNLIVNALDAMPEGGVLRIRAARDAGHVRLSFADTGAGMPAEVRERIFEPFFTTKGMQGTGLGLFVSYGIVERHGGRLGVESERGRGTTFTLTLPYADALPTDEARTRRDAVAAPQQQPALSVLVIDDEPFVRDTLVEMLSALGHNVAAADGGEAALAALDGARFDIVFTDLSMPRMDGWQVAREIRRRHGDRVRLVVITGHGKETGEPFGDSRLVDGVIGKPFDFTQVEHIIDRITEARQK